MSLSLHIAFLINVTSARVLLESSKLEQSFVKNVYRHSLNLTQFSPHFFSSCFPLCNLTCSPPSDRRALLTECLEQASQNTVHFALYT